MTINLIHELQFLFAVDYFALDGKSDATDDLSIREFLENDELTVLAAINHGDKLIFNHSISIDENCIVFYKIPQIGAGNRQLYGNGDATDNNLPLGMLTLEGGLAKSIYNSIAQVYSPCVTQVKRQKPTKTKYDRGTA